MRNQLSTLLFSVVIFSLLFGSQPLEAGQTPKIYVAFHWHMHQPVYWPYEKITDTANNPDCTDAVVEYLTWPDRVGAYTHYPMDTIKNHSSLPHTGAQISFSGSLIENINDLAAHGMGYGSQWMNYYREGVSWKTALGNPRIDMVAFGYHHPLMALCDYEDTRKQIQAHRKILLETFGGTFSKGIFPPENAFTKRMIPALVDEGIEWALVDNIHFDRANKNYPWTKQQIIAPPNAADQRNAAQPHYEALTCQQNTTNMVSTGFGFRPHWAQYIDPATGKAITPMGKQAKMIVVPTERSIGYDDSYGDRSPIQRLQQVEAYNTDPKHPFLIVLAHDGDNAGASGSRYYLETCGWISNNPDKYELVTVQDYLEMFPPDLDDVIHVEDGSWTGADLGDHEFKKWNGDPYLNGQLNHEKGYSPDRNSWAAITAAKNRVLTAEKIAPESSETKKAWHEFLVGTTSCYWYWDGTFEWDMKPAIACNNAVIHTDKILTSGFEDTIAPTVYIPQREPYNPGGYEQNMPKAVPSEPWTWESPWIATYPDTKRAPGKTIMSSDFTVWTLAYDASGLKSIKLQYRVSPEGQNEVIDQNLVYGGGQWKAIDMTGKVIPDFSPEIGHAKYKAQQYNAMIKGIEERLVDYYVEAIDGKGNVSRSPIQHVWVGTHHVPPQLVTPANPGTNDIITVKAFRPGSLHWAVNGWKLPNESYWPPVTVNFGDGMAVDTKLSGPDDNGHYIAQIGPFNGEQKVEEVNFVFHYSDNTWGSDQLLIISNSSNNLAFRNRCEFSASLLKLHRAANRFANSKKTKNVSKSQKTDSKASARNWSQIRDETVSKLKRSDATTRNRFLKLLEKLSQKSPQGYKQLNEVLNSFR